MSAARFAARVSAVACLSLVVAACTPGAPRRPTALNPNGISDDISAVTMTQSGALKPHDPNLFSTYPRGFETQGEPH